MFIGMLEMDSRYTISTLSLTMNYVDVQTTTLPYSQVHTTITVNQPLKNTIPSHYVAADYIGCVLSVGDVREPRQPSQKQVVWRDLILRNLEGDTVRFTLWNERARNFDTNAYENEPKPTVMAVSSCLVKTYAGLQLSSTPATYYYLNPPIPETYYILSMYDQLVTPPVIQNVRTYRYDNMEDEKRRNKVTIDELLREDPRNQTNVRLTVVATIEEVVVGIPWFFRRCHDCRRKIFDDRPHAHCEIPDPTQPNDYSYSFRLLISDNTGMLTLTCFSNEAYSIVTKVNKVVAEEGHTDPYTLPPHLTALEGTVHLFQLHFSTDSMKGNQVYVLDTVMETGPYLLLPPEQTLAVNSGIQQTPNERLLLTGHEPDSAVEEGTTSESQEFLQASTPVAIETTSHLQEQTTKTEVPRTSARRRLLTDNTREDAGSAAKKSKPVARK